MEDGKCVDVGGNVKLSEGYDTQMLDVSTMVEYSWDLISIETIFWCLVKSYCQPKIIHNGLSTQYRRNKSKVAHADV